MRPLPALALLCALLSTPALAQGRARLLAEGLRAPPTVHPERSRVAAMEDEARPVEALSKRELRAEYRRLEEEKPGLGGAIGLISSGAGMGVMAIYLFLINQVTVGLGGSSLSTLIVIGAVAAVAAAALVGLGLYRLFTVLPERRQIDARLDEVKQRLEELNHQETLDGAPPPDGPVPGVGLPPRPSWLVLRF